MTGDPHHSPGDACAAVPGIVPQWGVDARVRAFVTTRHGGISAGNWGLHDGSAGGLNLGARCGDDPLAVAENRARLARTLPSEPLWLCQVHGTVVHRARGPSTDAASEPRADAAVTREPGVVLAILTADCLPVLLADARGTAVGAVHAGWRGLSEGVLEHAVEAMRDLAGGNDVLAWLGPAIGPDAFEVGDDVRDAFCDRDSACAAAFVAGRGDGKWFANLYALARRRLARVGVDYVRGAGWCTVGQPQLFYSYRRDRSCGRMASLIWLESR